MYRTAQHIHCLQTIMPRSLLYNIHFNVTLKGGSMPGQPRKATAVAIQPSPRFFENPCQYSANPDDQALAKHSSRKSIKPLLGSSLLLFSLASATCAGRALLLRMIKEKTKQLKKAIILMAHSGCKKTLNCLKPMIQRYGFYTQLASMAHSAAMLCAVPGVASLSHIIGNQYLQKVFECFQAGSITGGSRISIIYIALIITN